MNSASILAATYIQGDENYSGSEWLNPKTTTYTPICMAEMASAAGLSCIPLDWPHPRGAKWILLCNLENGNDILDLAYRASEFHLHGKLDELQMKLAESEQRLSQLRTRPYVKKGIKIKRFLRRLSLFN